MKERDEKGRFVKGYKSDFQFKKGHISLNKRNDLDENKIISLYKNNNIIEIANMLDCGHSTIYNILNKNKINTSSKRKLKTVEQIKKGIQTRIKNGSYGEIFKKKISATKQEIPLEKWIKFTSFEPYTSEFNNQFKELVRQRDGFICVKCGIREEDAKILFKKKLICHHINYVKADTFKENCCSLCLRCNTEVNTNRISWTKFFQSLLSERYGYQYSESGEVILNLIGG